MLEYQLTNGIVSGGNADSRSWTYASCNWQMTLPAGTYRVSLWFIEQITSSNGYFNIYDSNGNTIITVGVAIRNVDSYTTTFTLSGETSIGIILKSFGSKYKIMLESGSTAHEWEPYTGGQASPNPSYPQEIKYVRGKNLFDKSLLEQGGMSGQPEYYGLDFESTSRVRTNYVEVLPNTTYSISINGTGKVIAYFFEYNSNKIASETVPYVAVNSNTHTFTTAPTTHYIRVAFGNSDSSNIVPSDVTEAQIEQNSQVTPYLPYNTIEEVVSGINIIGLDTNQYKVDLKAGDKITFKNEGTQALTLNLYTNYGDTTRNDFWSVGVNATRIITVAHDTKAIAWEVAPDGLAWGNYGDTLSAYEPYITPTSYQLSLGDHKFYGIGTYRDYILRTTGKNLFDKDSLTIEMGSIGAGGEFNPSTTRARAYTLDLKSSVTYTISSSNPQLNVVPLFYDSIGAFVSYNDGWKTMPYTFTMPSNATKLKLIFKNGSTDTITLSEITNIQIEIGSTASDYQPYGVGNWYKVGKINDYKITGNEAIAVNTDLTNTTRIGMYSALSDNPSVDVSVKLPLSNYFVGVQNWSGDVVGIYTNSSSIVFRVPKTIATTEQEIKTWLSSHNVIVCYALATPTYTPITGTLAEQLEAWWNAQSLDGTTIIEGNGDLPMIIKCRALKGE